MYNFTILYGTIKVMINYIYAYLTSFITMAVLDAAWLGLIAPTFYRKHVGFIMAATPNWVATAAFYLIFILGVTFFVVFPQWQGSNGYLKVALTGALFGFVTYATYDLTNQATIKNWPAIVTIVDLVWGTVLVAAVCTVSVFVLRTLVK